MEAVYDYFLKLPRIRFLLADDPGAGKTIMAGLLIKELKIRGTRIFVSVVLDNLAAGRSPNEIVADYPRLTSDDVHAAIAYAAELAHERQVPFPRTA